MTSTGQLSDKGGGIEMHYQLVTAKTETTRELLLMVDHKIVSQWPSDYLVIEDVIKEDGKFTGDLRGWENQLENGRDLSQCQADYDNDVLELERLLAVQCTAADFLANYDIATVLYRKKELSFDSFLVPDYDGSLSLKDYADCWGTIDLNSVTWFWDKKSGKPKLSHGEDIFDLKLFANPEGEFSCNAN